MKPFLQKEHGYNDDIVSFVLKHNPNIFKCSTLLFSRYLLAQASLGSLILAIGKPP